MLFSPNLLTFHILDFDNNHMLDNHDQAVQLQLEWIVVSSKIVKIIFRFILLEKIGINITKRP